MTNRKSHPQVAVVGFPNAGKSTLVNRLVGGDSAVTSPEPGVTRDRRSLTCEWNGVEFDLIDTGGLDFSDEDHLSTEVQRQAKEAIAQSDLILAVVDARAGSGPGESDLAALLRGSSTPVILIANKIDRTEDEYLLADLHRLGLGDPVPVSAAHGTGSGDLLDLVVTRIDEMLPGLDRASDTDGADSSVRIAVIGRPNVGKSSLVNRWLGSDRVIVSEMAGTTRDPVDTELEFEGERVVLVDTAGLRRKGKIGQSVDYYAQLRSQGAAEDADTAIVVCDASEGLTTEDLKVAELAMKSGCATLLLLNKWDVTRTDLEDAAAKASRKLKMRPEVKACSAATGRGTEKGLAAAIELAHRAAERIPTPELNRFVSQVIATTPPPEKRGRRLKIFYSAQVETSPPRFAMQVNDRKLINRDWAFHLENRLRAEYGMEGVPLIIDFVPRSGRRPRGSMRRGSADGVQT